MKLDFEFNLGFVPVKAFSSFTVTFERLPQLIDESWEHFNSAAMKRHSRVTISASCFSYYIWQHIYARIVNIKYLRHELDNDEMEMYLNYFRYVQKSPVPAEIFSYLLAIGDFKDVNGEEFEINFPIWPNQKGHFGRITKDTHYMYETLAAPSVLAKRIMEDLAYTKQGGKPMWNLEEQLVPIETNAGLPTRNLVGWDLRQRLTSRQMALIESAGVTVDDFNSNILRFMWNQQLFDEVSKSISNSGITLKYFHHWLMGDYSQIPWVYQHECNRFTPIRPYTTKALVLNSYCRLQETYVNTASAFCFRVRKDILKSLDIYCCYDFDEYKAVPHSWRLTRNTIFDYGDVGIWNLSTFEKRTSSDQTEFYFTEKCYLTNLIKQQARINYDSTLSRTIPSKKTFAITFEGLPEIIDGVYNSLLSSHGVPMNYISRSAFSYYIWIYIIEFLTKTSESVSKLIRSHTLPPPIQNYLNAIGNVQTLFGINLDIEFPICPNGDGHFGKITAYNHYKYEIMAAPAILAQRIMEDMAFTENPTIERTWNVRDIAPKETNAGLPTKNLLGWDYRELLSEVQMVTLKSVDITAENFDVQNEKLMLNTKLFEIVGTQMSNIYGVGGNPVSPNEERFSQILWQQRDCTIPEKFDRRIQYCERPMRQTGFCVLDSKTVTESFIYSFRVRKDRIQNLDSYCCYDFNNYQEVPDEWKETRNTIFEYGDVSIWNESKFISISTTKDVCRPNWIKHHMNQVKEELYMSSSDTENTEN